MITGVHVIVFAPEAERARAFFRDVLALESVDAGGGWPIFALPPAELACHPAEGSEAQHELYLMCDDLAATLAELRSKGVEGGGRRQRAGVGHARPHRSARAWAARPLRAAPPVATDLARDVDAPWGKARRAQRRQRSGRD
jgi:catechol 2,3-dioxygenase-like lactoylglutathione lyase family enzyme